jgi:hypothetical protein
MFVDAKKTGNYTCIGFNSIGLKITELKAFSSVFIIKFWFWAWRFWRS